MHELLSQTTDVIPAGSGWVGASVLGALVWMLWARLKEKDKLLDDKETKYQEEWTEREAIYAQRSATKDELLKATIENKDKQMAEVLDKKWVIIQELTRDYKSGLQEVVRHCEKEIGQQSTMWQR